MLASVRAPSWSDTPRANSNRASLALLGSITSLRILCLAANRSKYRYGTQQGKRDIALWQSHTSRVLLE